MPPVREQACKTKPICPEPEVGRGRPTHEETPEGQEQVCETKPICAAPSGRDARGRGRKRRRWGQLCETKPIRLGAIWTASAVWKESYDKLDPRMARQNKANFRPHRNGPGPAGRPVPSAGPIVRNKANSRARSFRRPAPSGAVPVVQTKPICPGPAARSTGGQGGECCRRWGQARQTKPIRRRGLSRQTKPISPGPGPRGSESCETNPICRSCQRSVVGRMCKTNPISVVARSETPHYSIIPGFQSSGVGRGAIVRNKANRPPGRCRAGRPTHEEARGNRAKRTQFGGESCEANPISGGRDTP
jgi:hypothetical protein